MIGIVEDKAHQTTLDFKQSGDAIYLIGESKNDISSSEYLYSYHKVKNSPAPYFNLDAEFNVQSAVTGLIRSKLIHSAHDVSDGGLFMALLESAMPHNLGFDITCNSAIRKDAFLFGEAQSRVLVSVKKENCAAFEAQLKNQNINCEKLGEVKGHAVVIDGHDYGKVQDFKHSYDTSIESFMS